MDEEQKEAIKQIATMAWGLYSVFMEKTHGNISLSLKLTQAAVAGMTHSNQDTASYFWDGK